MLSSSLIKWWDDGNEGHLCSASCGGGALKLVALLGRARDRNIGLVVGGGERRAGAWGDSFGAFNALVSSFASAAVLATLWLQSKSLKDQANDIHKQRFDASFFELLKLLREVRSEITFVHSDEYLLESRSARLDSASIRASLTGERAVKTPAVGHRAIEAAVKEYRYWISPGRMTGRKSNLLKAYEDRIHKNNEAALGPYFRMIYTILKRIKIDAVLSEQERSQYSNLLRSQLTSEELTLLAANGLAPFSNDLSDLIRDFHILKYLPESSAKRRFLAHYGSLAFAARD